MVLNLSQKYFADENYLEKLVTQLNRAIVRIKAQLCSSLLLAIGNAQVCGGTDAAAANEHIVPLPFKALHDPEPTYLKVRLSLHISVQELCSS